jgi:pimeloyl-ACP methyl ester carboxylesterase
MAKQTKPSIVFAHGLWADGSCFQKLIPTLQADGHAVMCSQHGLDSLKSDVECVTRCFGRVSGPVVLVGHSYGGTLITHARNGQPSRRTGLHRGPRTRRDRNLAKPAAEVSRYGGFLPHRGRRWAHLAKA